MDMSSMNTKGRFLILLAMAFLLTGSSALAQKVGSTSMQFLKVMPSARGTALGDAYSVWATGAEAIFWNPGGLAAIGNQEVSITYVDWLFDTQQGAFSYGLSLGNFGVVGAQIQYVDFGSFDETSNDPQFITHPDGRGFTGRTFRPFSYLVGLTYSRFLTERFSVGLGVKFAHESLFDGNRVQAINAQGGVEEVKTWANGVLFDFGLRYYTGFRSVYIATSVQNFGGDVTYAKQSFPVPLMFRFGIAADLVGANGLLVAGREDNRISAAFDIFHPNDYDQQMHAGLEYEFAGFLALRGGYKFNYDYDGLTLGVGLKHSLDSFGVAVDYSYGSMGTYLGNVQRISLGVILP
jgi:hypothetical protein